MTIQAPCETILDQLPVAAYYVDSERKIRFWNQAAQALTGYPRQEIVGVACEDAPLNHIDETGIPLCKGHCPLHATLADGQNRQAVVYLRHKEGYRVPVHVNIAPVRQGERIVGAVELFERVSGVMYEDRLIEQLTNASTIDVMTGLPNRVYTQSYLTHKFDAYQSARTPFALLFLDVDHFSQFNNTYGHDMGDAVLVNVAQALKKNMRKTDFIGRWGGEEFLGVYEAASLDTARRIGEKIRRLIENSTVFHNQNKVHVTASIGVTIIQPEDTIDALIKRADTLMYKSKEAGRNCVHVG